MRGLDDFGADIVDRCRWALDHNDEHPLGCWSTGEQLAVALVLFDDAHPQRLGYSRAEAAQRVSDGMSQPPSNFSTWLAAIRERLEAGRRSR